MFLIKKILFTLPFLLFCSHNENPFLNYSNARMCALRSITSFDTKGSDSTTIFTTETLTVAATVHELIDSFSISTEKNRLWSIRTIRHPTSEYYRFYLSFYDTGFQNISLITFRSNGDKQVEDILVKVKNQLHQNDIPKYNFADSITLSSGGVEDNDGVVYNWQFGKGGQLIQTPFPNINTVISFSDNEETQGLLWVSDSLFESPKVPFSFFFYDSTPPVIICVNDNYNKVSKTITTSDTIFNFMVRVTDRGNQSVNNVTIDGAQPDFKRMNIYTSIIKDVYAHTSINPLKVSVRATDNIQFDNDTTEIFFVVFDKKATPTGTTTLKISSITDSSTTTSRNRFNIFGNVENTMHHRVMLNMFLNNEHLKDTLIDGFGNWNVLLSLREEENSFHIIAKDTINNILDSQSVTIIYKQNAIDTVPPVILSKEIDGQLIENETFFTENDSANVQITTFDAGYGVRKIMFNNDSLMVQENNYKSSFTIRGLQHKQNSIRLQIVDFKGNTCKDTLHIIKNSPPVFTIKNSIPYVVFIGTTYTDTIHMSDNDGDPVTLQILSKPNSMTINSNGSVKWTPEAQDVSKSFAFQCKDGFTTTPPNYYEHAVMDPQKMSPYLEISDAIEIPSFLEANADTLKSVIKIKAGTGKQPFIYTADLVNRSKQLLTRSADSLIFWRPQESDTGVVELRIIVLDSLRFSDTLYRSITIVPQNKNPAKLTWKTTLDTTTEGELILAGLKDTALVNFHISDADDPRTEKHIITIRSRGQVSTSQVNSDTFTIKLFPVSNNVKDTLQVIINDYTGTADTVTIPLVNVNSPDLFPGLYSWFDEETIYYGYPTHVIKWRGKGENPFVFDYWIINNIDLYAIPNTINGRTAIKFENKNNFLINSTKGNLFDSKLSIFIVAKYDSIPENLTLISLNKLDSSINKTTGFGVTKEGKAGVFSRLSQFGSTTTKNSSKLSVSAHKWHVFSLSTTGVNEGQMPVDIGIDRVHDTIMTTGYSAPGLILGRCYRDTPMFSWNGGIAEVIIFNRVLSFAERTSVEYYLSEKYNLQ